MKLPFLSLFLFVGLSSAVWLQAEDSPSGFAAIESQELIVLKHQGNEILTYHKAEVPPPEGADPVFARSGFIHPLKTPKGATLTGMHPPDHVHHLGLWHAWVHCQVEGKEVDFWNLKKGLGRVRYARTLACEASSERVRFAVEQEHVATLEEGAEPVVILRETFEVAARLVDGAYEIDYQTAQTNVSPYDLELPAYRYGGTIAYRAPAYWDKTNSDYLSSEGKTRVDGHETRSRWCAFWGPEQKASSNKVSLAILSHSQNHDAPQRMRVWPPTDNNGAIFFNYVPIQESGRAIKSGETSTMRYRLVAADAMAETDALDRRWERFVKETPKR